MKHSRTKRLFSIAAALLFFVGALGAQEKSIVILNVRDVIDFAQSAYTERVIKEAIADGHDTIVLAIDSPGGRVDATFKIVKTIFENDGNITFIAFVEHNALSAAALIAMACEKVYMQPGSNIGAAEPIIAGKDGIKTAGEKINSALRAEFRSVAQRRGRDANIAEAMVDKSIELYELPQEDGKPLKIITLEEKEKLGDKGKGLKTACGKDKLLTLTNKEAITYGIADKILNDKIELAEELGVPVDSFAENNLTWSEKLVRFLNNPVISGLLLMVGMMGLYMEFKIPGFGLPGIVGLVCLGLMVGSKMFVGLAGWLEVILITVGLLLILLEIFVIPGFGVAGISGVILLASGIILTFIPIMSRGFNWQPFALIRLQTGLMVFIFGIAGSLVAFAILVKYLPKVKSLSGIMLDAEELAEEGYVTGLPEDSPARIGCKGIAITTLRPSGTIQIDGKRVDVVTLGDFIEPGTEVEVYRIEGSRIVVVASKAEGA